MKHSIIFSHVAISVPSLPSNAMPIFTYVQILSSSHSNKQIDKGICIAVGNESTFLSNEIQFLLAQLIGFQLVYTWYRWPLTDYNERWTMASKNSKHFPHTFDVRNLSTYNVSTFGFFLSSDTWTPIPPINTKVFLISSLLLFD